jgi:hypothetical protein
MATLVPLNIVEQGSDDVRLEELSQHSRSEGPQLEVHDVALASGPALQVTRSGLGVLAGALVATFQPAALVSVVRPVIDRLWSRNGKWKVRVKVDGDVLELTGADDAVQRMVVDDGLARHGTA